MGRGDQLARTWKIIKHLERQRVRGLRIDELTAEVGWNKRTIYRDINALIDAGFPIEKELFESHVYYRFNKAFRDSLPPTFTMSEVVALSLSQNLMHALKGTVFYDAIESAMSKMRALFPASALLYLSRMESALHLGFFPKNQAPELGRSIDMLYEAVISKKVCKITYRSASSRQSSQRLIEPLKIWFTNGSMYVVAFDRKSGDQRTFAISRILKCDIAPQETSSDHSFDFDEYRKSALHVWRGESAEVVLRFSSHLAPIIDENLWHDSQQTRHLSDGGLELRMKVAITPELENWILSWAEHVIVLSPPNLQERIHQKAILICAQYAAEEFLSNRRKN